MDSSAIRSLASNIVSIERVHYACISALAFAIYDLFLTLPLELQLIWNDAKATFSVRKIFYFMCRYGVVLDSIVLVVVSFPHTEHSKSWCIGLSASTIVIILFVEASGHCNTLFSIFLLWERDAKIKRIMIAVTASSYIVACGMLIKFLGPILQDTSFLSIQLPTSRLYVCTLNFNSKLALGIWAPAVCVDVCAIALLWWNSLDQPRASNVRVISILTHDGIVLLLAGFGLRLSVILITFVSDFSTVLFAAFYIEFINAALNIRLFLMLRGRRSPHLSSSVSDDWIDEPVGDLPKPFSMDLPLKRLTHAGEYIH